MTVASIKNYSTRTRCIVQLLQSTAKSLLLNIPSFGIKTGDCVLCFHELELSLMARSCVAPGAATLISNMIRIPSANLRLTDTNTIVHDYFRGCHMEIYLEAFSPYFHGMTFFQAVGFCSAKLDVLLIGLFKPEKDNARPGLLLCPSDAVISQERIGIFIAHSTSALHRVKYFCERCHKDVSDLNQISKCACDKEPVERHRKSLSRDPFERLLIMSDKNAVFRKTKPGVLKRPAPGWEKKLEEEIRQIATLKHSRLDLTEEDVNDTNGVIHRLDFTGNFHWSPAKPFRSVLMNQGEAVDRRLSGHIVVLILAKPGDPKIGLINFVVPLRSSRIPFEELKDIVFVGNADYMDKEWPEISDLPKISFIDGDPLNRADLRSVSIKTCSMCVIISSWTGSTQNPVLDDRDAILAALNVKAMPFEDVDRDGNDTGYFGVPLLTEIQHDQNIRLLNTTKQDDVVQADELYLTEPFMCGEAVSFGALDSLFVTTYQNPLIVPILHHLLYGFQSPQMDAFLAEGVGLIGGAQYSPESISPYNTRIDLIGVRDALWKLPAQKAIKYFQLVEAAALVGKICLGLSRIFRDEKDEKVRHEKRCVLTNPDRFYDVQSDDLVFVLTQ